MLLSRHAFMVVFVLSQTDRAHRGSKGLEHQLVKAVGFTSAAVPHPAFLPHLGFCGESSKAFQQPFLPLW